MSDELASQPGHSELLPIVALVGPTGTGKTALAIELCRRYPAEIVGADSVQVYRGFDVGSSKPTQQELGEVRHHLTDVLEPIEAIDAARFAELADDAIAEITARGRLPIVVGGTGLWLRALLRGLLPLPSVDRALRARLESEFDRKGGEAMHARLSRVDPSAATRIHENDKVRVVRALEVYEQTGRPLGELRAAHALGDPRYDALTVLIDLPHDQWRNRIAQRVEQMFEVGFVDEVARLVARYGAAIKPLQSVGYRQLLQHMPSPRDLELARLQVCRAHFAYGKRQRTWFRNEPGIDLRLTPEQARASATLAAMEGQLSLLEDRVR